MADEDDWFISPYLGKIGIAHWKGAIVFAALFVVGFAGMGVESALKPDHPILEIVLIVPLGGIFLGLAWTIAARTRRD